MVQERPSLGQGSLHKQSVCTITEYYYSVVFTHQSVYLDSKSYNKSTHLFEQSDISCHCKEVTSGKAFCSQEKHFIPILFLLVMDTILPLA